MRGRGGASLDRNNQGAPVDLTDLHSCLFDGDSVATVVSRNCLVQRPGERKQRKGQNGHFSQSQLNTHTESRVSSCLKLISGKSSIELCLAEPTG